MIYPHFVQLTEKEVIMHIFIKLLTTHIACLQSRDFLPKWRAIEQPAHNFSHYSERGIVNTRLLLFVQFRKRTFVIWHSRIPIQVYVQYCCCMWYWETKCLLKLNSKFPGWSSSRWKHLLLLDFCMTCESCVFLYMYVISLPYLK